MSHFFLNWNVFDYIITAILLLFVIIGLVRGLLRELITLVSWFFAFFAALKFAPALSAGFMQSVISSDKPRYVVSAIIIFLIVVILGAVVNKLVHLAISSTGFGFFDKFLGLIFGAARGVLVVTIMLVAIQATAYQTSTWYKESQLSPRFQPIVAHFIPMLPKEEHAATWVERLKAFAKSVTTSADKK